MKKFVREIEPEVILYRDTDTGIAWAEDHRAGLGISVHPNIDETGCVEGMVTRGWWRADDRTVKSHGWIYNIDRLAYDEKDTVEVAVVDACMCPACVERREEQGEGKKYVCPVCHNTEHLPGAKFCMICGEPFPLSKQMKGVIENGKSVRK